MGFQLGSRRFGTTRVDGNLFTKFGPNFLFEVVRPARGCALHTTSAALGGPRVRASPPHKVVHISLREAFPTLVLVVMYLERMVMVRAVFKQQARWTRHVLPAALLPSAFQSHPMPCIASYTFVHLPVRVRLDAERAVISRRIRSLRDRSRIYSPTRFDQLIRSQTCLPCVHVRRRALSARASDPPALLARGSSADDLARIVVQKAPARPAGRARAHMVP